MLFGALVFACWAYWAGQDASWDLQNYHDYAAYALLHWRYRLDVGMGGFQGYLNPLPYVVPYALRHTLPPFAAGLALAVVQSVVVAVVWALSGVLLPSNVRHPHLLRSLATVLGCTGATVLSEIGTSFADLPVATLVLGGVALLLAAVQTDGSNRRRAPHMLVAAGFLVGAAAGLKLTNAVYAPGLLAAAALSWRRPLGVGWAVACTGAGLLAGYLATGGIWAAYMWVSLGNPVFPALNKVFQSPSAAFSDYTEIRFLPAGFLDGLTYPVRIALGEHPTAEVPFAEPRFLVVLCVLFVTAVVSGLRRACGQASNGQTGRTLTCAGTFLLTSMALWLKLFARHGWCTSASTSTRSSTSLVAGTRCSTHACELPFQGHEDAPSGAACD